MSVVTALSTEQLVLRCRAGETDAWSAIVDRFGRLVHGIALREGLSREDAADVTQDVFMALLERLEGIEAPERLPWWLMTVARRASWRRRDAGRRLAPDEGAVGLVDSDLDTALQTVTPPAEMDGLIEAMWVHEAMATLSSPCRDLLELLFLDPAEPSYQQIARLLDMPIGSIGSCRARCLERLRRELVVEVGP